MKTKIICTIGPASSSGNMLKKLFQAGMAVARVNCSHGTMEGNEETINRIKAVRRELGVPVSIMLDTKGPDIRIGRFENGAVDLKDGQTFTLTTVETVGNDKTVFVDCKKLLQVVKAGNAMLLNDGFVRMTVKSVTGTDIVCKVVTGGRLTDRKTLFVPGVASGLPFISKEDERDLLLAIRADVDYIAASFVSGAKDVTDMKKFLRKNGMDIPVIAKIESMGGVAEIDGILKVADGIMTARGDLGVEYPIEQVPTIQKFLTGKAVRAGKFIITATEMLESMIEQPRPTRAETTDVANAVYDGTSAIMLSAETAVGRYPVQTVGYMKKIAEEAESQIKYDRKFYLNGVDITNQKEAFANTITGAAIAAKARAIVVFTQSGGTAVRVSKYRPNCPVYAFAREEKVFHQLAMLNSVTPIFCPQVLTVSQMLNMSNEYILGNRIAKKGEIIVVNASYHDTDTDLVLIHPLK